MHIHFGPTRILLRCSYPLLPRRNGACPPGSAAAHLPASACVTMYCVILQTAHERLYRGSDIRILRHSVFLVFSSYLYTTCAQDSSPVGIASTPPLPPQTPPDARNSSHSNIGSATAACDAPI